MNKGCSVIELVVICAIIATFSVVLILNFKSSPKTKIARNQIAAVIVSDIRRMQSSALAGSRYQGGAVCGYGIHYINKTSYLLYAGVLDGGITSCINTNHNYQAGTDYLVETKNITNLNMEIRSAFSDVFFESPDPKTYINNNSLLSGSPITISVQLKNQQNCAQQSCTQITVYPSGKIDLAN